MASRIKEELRYSRRDRKRSDLDIMANILDEAHDGAKKTRIMYKCNLSHRQLEVYLRLLSGMGLLAYNSKKDYNGPGLFETTAKGTKLLEAYRTLRVLMT